MKKNFLTLIALLMLLFIATSCDNKESRIEPNPMKNNKPSSQRIADGTIQLAEVTIYAISLRGNNFDMILGWYNNTTHNEERQTVSVSAFDGIAIDDDALNSPEFKDKVIAYFKQRLLELGVRNGLNVAEIAILKTMDVRQILHYGYIFVTARTYGYNLIGNGALFAGEGPDEGFANAFVHLTLSFRFKQAFGVNLAQQLLDAHESEQSPSDIRSIMDRRNNAIGLYVLSSEDQQTLIGFATSGSLWTIRGGELGQYVFILNVNNPRHEQP